MWRWCGEGALAQAADGFASLNRHVLPSSAGLSNSHLKATAGQSYRCQQADSKQSFFLTRPLGSGIPKQEAAAKVPAGVLWIVRILANGQRALMLRRDAGCPGWSRLLPTSRPLLLPSFEAPLSSRWGSEVGINCTSERLPLPSWCLLRSQPAVFVLTLKFIPQSESSFQSISIHNALTRKDATLGNLDSSSSLSISLASLQCNYMHFRQAYIQL